MGITPDDFIRDLLNKAPKLSGVDADIILYDLYETNFGIFNHIGASKQRPLASVAMHPCEDNTHSSRTYEIIEQFASRGIGELFKISVLEYLALPTDICIKMLEVASMDSSKKNTALANIEASLKEVKK
jgi:hypothetical protein